MKSDFFDVLMKYIFFTLRKLQVREKKKNNNSGTDN